MDLVRTETFDAFRFEITSNMSRGWTQSKHLSLQTSINNPKVVFLRRRARIDSETCDLPVMKPYNLTHDTRDNRLAIELELIADTASSHADGITSTIHSQ
jgi:hypothetical protein